jgi:hypothetical protein
MADQKNSWHRGEHTVHPSHSVCSHHITRLLCDYKHTVRGANLKRRRVSKSSEARIVEVKVALRVQPDVMGMRTAGGGGGRRKRKFSSA